MLTNKGRGGRDEAVDWALEPAGEGRALLRISVEGQAGEAGVRLRKARRGFRLSVAGLVREGQREELLAFLTAFAEGRRAIYAPEGSDFALYADPRAEGTRLTVECFGESHATCGVTVTRDRARELVTRLVASRGPHRRPAPRD